MKKTLFRRLPNRRVSHSVDQPLLSCLEQHLSFAPRPRCADASVLLALTDEAQPRVLLTRRSMQLSSHAGEVSLPGGKRDPADYPLVAQPDEIDRIFYVPLAELLACPPQAYQIEMNGRRFAVPSFQVDNEIIWGLTGRILVSMIERGLGHRIDWPLFLMRYAGKSRKR